MIPVPKIYLLFGAASEFHVSFRASKTISEVTQEMPQSKLV